VRVGLGLSFVLCVCEGERDKRLEGGEKRCASQTQV